MRLVLCSCPSALAEAIRGELLEKRLASSINAVPGVVRTTALETAAGAREETLLLIQTAVLQPDDLLETLARLHPAGAREFLVLPVLFGDGVYLEWAQGTPPAPAAHPDDDIPF